ncbi:lipopolysaccharide kinase InaA family protein [Ectopseudomonas alcaliphila]|nr:lipopolysaccharide kinase InaA family protein [Pseudomonas alcaliphila]MDX5992491.1 lipopolysaccharide kinase InaA family protein [Pseudomonas alcaliphila]
MTKPTVQVLSQAAFEQLVVDARSIEEDSYGPKVYLLSNGDYLKLFRRKRLISSALLTPYSLRFWRNAQRLQRLGIPTVTPQELFRLPKAGWTAVRYQALAGITLKTIYEQQRELTPALLQELVKLFRDLHGKGIYFRSMHLGNIVLTEDGQLGLIDIADLKFQSGPLPRAKVQRNLAHFERYLKHNHLMPQFPFTALCEQVLAP